MGKYTELYKSINVENMKTDFRKKTAKERGSKTRTGTKIESSLFDGKVLYIGVNNAHKEPEQINKTLVVWWEKPSKESSNLKSFAYSEQEAIMALQFHSGKTYTYTQVPLEVYKRLKQVDAGDESLGKWVIANITTKPQLYTCKPQN